MKQYAKKKSTKDDVNNLLNWAMGQPSIDKNIHEKLYEFIKMKYEVEKKADGISNNIKNYKKLHGYNEKLHKHIIPNYDEPLKYLIGLLNKIAPEGTKLIVHNGIYQYGEHNQFGPPDLE